MSTRENANEGVTTSKGSNINVEKTKPKKSKTALKIIGWTLAGAAVLDGLGAIGTEITDGKPFVNSPDYTPEYGMSQKAFDDIRNPLGFIKNLRNDPVEPDVVIPSTYTEIIDQAALDHATGKDGTPIDYSSTINPTITASETMFQAKSNGIIVSDSQLASLLESAIKPFDESTHTADVSLLFPVKNPGNQIITVDKIAHCIKGSNIDGAIGDGVFINWETVLTVPNKGTEIIMPVPVDAEVYRIAPTNIDGKTYPINTALICFTGPDGANYELLICGKGTNEKDLPFSIDSLFPSLADAPEIDYDTHIPFRRAAETKGKILPTGITILKTINNNAKIGFYLRCDKKIARPDINFISFEENLVLQS
jgi:hypothetical protein